MHLLSFFPGCLLKKVSSHVFNVCAGSFHLIHLMFDDYVLYLLESLHCQERANDLMRAMKGEGSTGEGQTHDICYVTEQYDHYWIILSLARKYLGNQTCYTNKVVHCQRYTASLHLFTLKSTLFPEQPVFSMSLNDPQTCVAHVHVLLQHTRC